MGSKPPAHHTGARRAWDAQHPDDSTAAPDSTSYGPDPVMSVKLRKLVEAEKAKNEKRFGKNR